METPKKIKKVADACEVSSKLWPKIPVAPSYTDFQAKMLQNAQFTIQPGPSKSQTNQHECKAVSITQTVELAMLSSSEVRYEGLRPDMGKL
eukprot:3088742-Amphidinium_carterae.1